MSGPACAGSSIACLICGAHSVARDNDEYFSVALETRVASIGFDRSGLAVGRAYPVRDASGIGPVTVRAPGSRDFSAVRDA